MKLSFYTMAVLCLLSLVTPAYSQTDSALKAKVYFMRSVGAKAASGAFNIFIDDVMICKINEGKFVLREIPAGIHYVSVQSMGKKSSDKIDKTYIEMEAGKTYYIQTVIRFGEFFSYVRCREVTNNTAKLLLPKLREDKSCSE
jgi:uncharacterized Fe-S cluster-containing radical SAM superfamily enzyme